VESIVKEDGLNKSALGRMRKVDSFIKESHRFSGTGACVYPILWLAVSRNVDFGALK
jgi:hypothetical protein